MVQTSESQAVPDRVRALAGRDRLRLVWRNDVGGLTFQVNPAGGGSRFVKWAPAGSGLDLAAEVVRLRWAARWTAVPRVLADGADERGSWIVTAGLAGTNAVSQDWVSKPEVAIGAIGAGLRALHDTLPVVSCPFSWSAADRIADAHRRAVAGRINLAGFHPEHRHLDVPAALALVARPPEVDRLVVCHGDACAPNTVLDDSGRVSGHVDLGALGVADRWADLAVATWSATWNYGPGWEPALLAAYGVDPDPERTSYYRLLYDLGP